MGAIKNYSIKWCLPFWYPSKLTKVDVKQIIIINHSSLVRISTCCCTHLCYSWYRVKGMKEKSCFWLILEPHLLIHSFNIAFSFWIAFVYILSGALLAHINLATYKWNHETPRSVDIIALKTIAFWTSHTSHIYKHQINFIHYFICKLKTRIAHHTRLTVLA